MKRYTISAYCHRCNNADGIGSVEMDYDEDAYGDYIKYDELITFLEDKEEFFKTKAVQTSESLHEKGLIDQESLDKSKLVLFVRMTLIQELLEELKDIK